MHRHPLTSTSYQSREKSPNTNRNSLTTITTLPPPSANKIDKDILKHASRIRRISPSKDFSIKSPRKDTTSLKQNSINKPLKSISLVSYYNLSQIFVYFFVVSR